jgi:hypothetical protein
MTTLAALQRRTVRLEQETRRLYPASGPDVLEDWLQLFDDEHERDQARLFLESIEPHLGRHESGAPNLTRLTDDELDELARWAKLAKEREQGGRAR